MLKSDTISEIAKALGQAQLAFDAIKRDRTVKVQTKTGGSYTFAYAPLDTILAAIRPALASQGLSLVQACHVNEGVEWLRTTLLHSSGEWLANDTSVFVSDRGPQAYGSALTYAARYGVTRLLCLASEDDDDGNAAEGNHAERIQRGKPKAEKFDPITAEQAAELQTWAADLGVELAQFCKFMSVPSLAEIPSSRYEAARNALESKQRAMRKAELEA